MAGQRISVKELLEKGVYSQGKAVHLYRIFYEHGPANGTGLFLPVDQGLEHGPVDFFPNPPSVDPDFQCRLALEGKFSAIEFQPGPSQVHPRLRRPAPARLQVEREDEHPLRRRGHLLPHRHRGRGL